MAIILLVEDDADYAETLNALLSYHGHRVAWVQDGESALAQVKAIKPDLIILDLLLPSMSGLDVCKRLRQLDVHVPVVILTALGSTPDRVTGLDAGADYYLDKCADILEVLAVARSLLRGQIGGRPTVVRLGDVEIDLEKRIVHRGKEKIGLTATEHSILTCLVEARGQCVSRQELEARIWGGGRTTARSLNQHIANLRKKLGDQSGTSRYILSDYGVGYRLGSGLT